MGAAIRLRPFFISRRSESLPLLGRCPVRTPGRMRAGEHPNQMRPAPGEEKKENWRKPVSPYHAAIASKSQKKRHREISAPDIPRIIPRGMSGARSLRARWCGNPVDLPGVFQRAASLSIALLSSPPHSKPPAQRSPIHRRPSHTSNAGPRKEFPRPCVSVSKKSPRPAAFSNLLNLISSENCLMERERGFLPLSLYPRCSIMELHFIVF